MSTNLLISFEGGEGCGKTTQIQRLASRLTEAGKTLLLTREPGGTDIGEQLRYLLQFAPEGQAIFPETEVLLFAASRAQLVREKILPALQAGTIVLADRFLDSTTVYQGAARQLEAGRISEINRFAVGTCLPSLTFIFDIDPKVARERIADRTGTVDRIESQPAAFHRAVRAGYLALLSEKESRFRLLDATHSIEKLEEQIWQAVEPLLLG